MPLLSVDLRNLVAELDIKFIHKLGDRQKSAASLEQSENHLLLENQFYECICGAQC